MNMLELYRNKMISNVENKESRTVQLLDEKDNTVMKNNMNLAMKKEIEELMNHNLNREEGM